MSYLDHIRSRLSRRKVFFAYACVVLRDDQGRVLLQHRTDFDIWAMPGGILELGEDLLTCARRELLEETGLEAGPLRLVGVFTDPRWHTVYPNGDEVEQYNACFEGVVRGGQSIPDGEETTEQAFFDPADIPFAQLPPWYQAMLDAALAGKEAFFDPPFSLPERHSQIDTIRRFVGHDPIIAPGSAAAVVDGQGRILMALRRDHGNWHFPGGYMDHGENIAHTVVREILEETGLQVVPERLLGVFSPRQMWTYPNGDQVQSVVNFFRARLVGGELRPDPVETRQLAWMSSTEIARLEYPAIMHPLIPAVLETLETGCFVI
jgi:8-oxo-dGTP diphosphatase